MSTLPTARRPQRRMPEAVKPAECAARSPKLPGRRLGGGGAKRPTASPTEGFGRVPTRGERERRGATRTSARTPAGGRSPQVNSRNPPATARSHCHRGTASRASSKRLVSNADTACWGRRPAAQHSASSTRPPRPQKSCPQATQRAAAWPGHCTGCRARPPTPRRGSPPAPHRPQAAINGPPAPVEMSRRRRCAARKSWRTGRGAAASGAASRRAAGGQGPEPHFVRRRDRCEPAVVADQSLLALESPLHLDDNMRASEMRAPAGVAEAVGRRPVDGVW